MRLESAKRFNQEFGKAIPRKGNSFRGFQDEFVNDPLWWLYGSGEALTLDGVRLPVEAHYEHRRRRVYRQMAVMSQALREIDRGLEESMHTVHLGVGRGPAAEAVAELVSEGSGRTVGEILTSTIFVDNDTRVFNGRDHLGKKYGVDLRNNYFVTLDEGEDASSIFFLSEGRKKLRVDTLVGTTVPGEVIVNAIAAVTEPADMLAEKTVGAFSVFQRLDYIERWGREIDWVAEFARQQQNASRLSRFEWRVIGLDRQEAAETGQRGFEEHAIVFVAER